MESDPLYSWSDNLPLDTSLKSHWSSQPIPSGETCEPPSDYPTTQTLVYCAWLVYKDNVENATCKTPQLKGWQILVKGHSSSSGYHGLALWHPIHRQLVIAHRGTKINNIGALWADLKGVVINKIPGQMLSAVSFTYHVLDTMKDLPENVFMVGHSLGGWLAAVSTYSAQYLSLVKKHFAFKTADEEVIRPHTVTFDAPGSREILTKLQDAYEFRLKESNSLRELDITNFVSGPSSINSQNHHVGVLIRVSNTTSHTTSEHSIKTFKHIFDSNGNIVGDVYKAIDWPAFGTDLGKFKKYTDPVTGKSTQSALGYNTIKYKTEPYSECQSSVVVLHPLAKEFVHVYQEIRRSDSGFIAEVTELDNLKNLRNCTISNDSFFCSSPQEMRELIPRVNRMCRDNVTITLKLLTQRNIQSIEPSMLLLYKTSYNTFPIELQSECNINIVSEDKLEVAIQRLHQVQKDNEKQTLVITEADLVYLKTLEQTKKEIRKKSKDLLIVLSCLTVDSYRKCFDELQVLQSQIWTLSTKNSRIETLWKALDEPFIQLGKTRWCDLELQTKHQLLQRKLVIFQERPEPFCLGDIIPSAQNDDVNIESVMDEDTLEKLILRQDITLFEAPKPPPELYINRKLYTQELDPNLLRKVLETHTCYVSGISRIDFQLRHEIRDEQESKIYFVDDFSSLNSSEKGNKLFVDYNHVREVLSVVNIQGGYDDVNNFIEEVAFTEDDVISNSRHRRASVICGEPGVGKSSLLKRFSNNFKRTRPDSLVLLLNLNDHTSVFRKHLSNGNLFDTYSNLIEFLAKDLLMVDAFEMNLLRYILDHPQADTTILLDSFDEVSPDYMELVLNFVFALQRFTKVHHLVLATRSHLTKILQNSLFAPSLTLKSFNESEKSEFLNARIKDQIKFDEIHQILFENVQDNLGLTDNPLILEMMAAISEEGSTTKPIRSVSDLYHEFTERKMSVYKSKIPDTMGNVMAENNFHLGKERALKLHEKLARVLTDDFFQNDNKLKISDEETEMMLKIGIVEKTRHALSFVHRSFAEYFVAKWLLKILYQNNVFPDLNIHILHTILVKRQYKNIRYLLNDMLINICKTPQSTPQEWIRELNEFRKINIPPFLMTSVRENHRGIIEYFWSRLGNTFMEELSATKNSLTILHAAAMYHKYDVIVFLEQNLPEELLQAQWCRNENDADGITYIQLFFTNKKMGSQMIDCALDALADPVHTQLKNTLFENLRQHLDRLMLHSHMYSLTEKNIYPNAQKSILTNWIYNNVKTRRGVTMNTSQTQNVEPSTSQQIENKFDSSMKTNILGNKNRLNEMLKRKDDKGLTVLHRAVVFNDNNWKESELLERFEMIDVNLWSIQDTNGETPLHIAAKYGNFKVLQCIHNKISNTKYWNWTNNYGNTVVHVALEYGKFGFSNTSLDLLKWLEMIEDDAVWSMKNHSGNTPLHIAASCGKYKILLFVSNKHPNIDYLNWTDKDECTVLHVAKRSKELDDSDLVKWLEKIRDVSVWSLKDQHGNTPLHRAALHWNSKMLLYAHNMIPNRKYFNWKTNNGHTVLHLAMIDIDGNDDGGSEMWEWLEMICDVELWSGKDIDGNTPLHFAATRQKYRVLRYVHNIIPIHDYLIFENREKKSVLHFAMGYDVNNDKTGLFDWLEMITDVNLWAVRDDKNSTPLHYAAYHRKYKVLQFVHKKFSNHEYLNWKNITKETVIHVGMRSDNHDGTETDLLEWLELITDQNVWSVQDALGNTTLHQAAKTGNYKVLLLIHDKMSEHDYWNWQNNDGLTVLHMAMIYTTMHGTETELREWLDLINNVNVWSVQDSSGSTPLHYAAGKNHYHILLFVHKKMPNMDYLNWTNIPGRTIWHVALEYAQTENKQSEFLKWANHVNVWSVRDVVGDTPLHVAALNGYFQVVSDAQTNFQDQTYLTWKNNKRQTVLHKAMQSSGDQSHNLRLLECVKLFTGDPNIWTSFDAYGNTPIHYAARSGYFCVLIYLHTILNTEEYLFIKNASGETAVHTAMQFEIQETEHEAELVQWMSMWKNPHAVWLVTDGDGNTPVHYAAYQGHFNVLATLHRTMRNTDYLSKLNLDGQTPLHMAMQCLCCGQDLLRWVQVVKDDLAWMIPDADGKTPKHYIADLLGFEAMILAFGRMSFEQSSETDIK